MKCTETNTIVQNVSISGNSGDPVGNSSSDRITFECDLEKGHDGPHICKKEYKQLVRIKDEDGYSIKVYFKDWYEFKWKDEAEEAMKMREKYLYNIERKEWIK